jgi:predicted nucleic acid-binding protein
MKTKFSWYFKASNEEINDIWNNGILTVDTNVLLDLYRYHEKTRNSLLDSLSKFDKRVWLSHQAAEEFFRNRSTAICSSEKTFQDAIDEIEKLNKGLNTAKEQLKGNRIIPADISDFLSSEITPIIENAKTKIEDAHKNYPEYLKVDPILDKISSMFNNASFECVFSFLN